MFRNLRTSRKLFILCGMFVVALSVTTYSLVAEKLIAIEFAKKELSGSQYLTAVRKTYDAILLGRENSRSKVLDGAAIALQAAETKAAGAFATAELMEELATALRKLAASEPALESRSALNAFAKARALALRVGDDSNLTLDPDLDTYYLQTIVVTNLPDALGQLGELQTWASRVDDPDAPLDERRMRSLVVDSLLRSNGARVQENLTAAYRGNSDGRLKREIEFAFATMIANINSYLGNVSTRADRTFKQSNKTLTDHDYQRAVGAGINAWSVAQAELDRLLNVRIDRLVNGLRYSLLLTGALGGLSIVLAILTHRHIVTPLERFETIANAVSESKDYTLRIDQSSRDEIGRLAMAFNGMLSELAAAREREISEQSEAARVLRMTTLGAMSASIAHEINQPLAAIVTNSNAALRWLGHSTPDLDEARSALKRIVEDGHRASQVIAGIRAAFKKDGGNKVWLSVADVVHEVLRLSRGNLQKQAVTLEIDLDDQLPPVLADRVQLQQVLLNLIVNASDAMASVTNRPRLLQVRSGVHDAGAIQVSVADSGTGIDEKDRGRVFDAFFTTKSAGMGMGLFICRSIIEAHGGRLWACPGDPNGTVFCLVLPTGKTDGYDERAAQGAIGGLRRR